MEWSCAAAGGEEEIAQTVGDERPMVSVCLGAFFLSLSVVDVSNSG